MSVFTVFALILLALVTLFALANPTQVSLRFLMWQFETTLALAVVAAAVFGGVLVFISSIFGQQHLRARLRDMQARLRELESRAQASSVPPDQKP